MPLPCPVRLSRMNGVNDAVEIIREQKRVGARSQQATRASLDDRLAGLGDEEAGEKILRPAVGGSEADDAIAGAYARMARAVQCPQKTVLEDGVGCVEVLEAEWRTVRREGGVGGGNAAAVDLRRGR